MNEIVSKFIEEQKEKQKVELQKQREEHLVELGLIDEELAVKSYAHPDLSEKDAKTYGYTHQDSKGLYKIEGVAMKVSDEEYEEICKLCPPKKGKSNSNNPKGSNFAEKAALWCAWFIFIVGIFQLLHLLIDGLFYWYEDWEFEIGAGVVMFSTISWSIMLVLVNISHKLDR